MNSIVDYTHYIKEMEKGLMDKLFFVDKIDFTNILDYGCADGALINSMAQYYPEKNYVGYDFNPDMIQLATSKNIRNSSFHTNLGLANQSLKKHKGNSIVLCSSLIHEVYSYGSPLDIEIFWNNLYSGDYDYIVIRDMALDASTLDLKTNLKDLNALMKHGDPKQIDEFESVWGGLDKKKNAIHFLLKYKYLTNWKREVNENYFAVTTQEHLAKIPDNFSLIHFEHFILPHQQQTIQKEFGITLKENTHIKMIIKCNR